jgi:transcriptional regulator with XRE-family HTH domain
MIERDWSLRQMAQATGVNHVSLHHMLRGSNWPNAEHLAQIEQALQLQLWPRLGEVNE